MATIVEYLNKTEELINGLDTFKTYTSDTDLKMFLELRDTKQTQANQSTSVLGMDSELNVYGSPLTPTPEAFRDQYNAFAEDLGIDAARARLHYLFAIATMRSLVVKHEELENLANPMAIILSNDHYPVNPTAPPHVLPGIVLAFDESRIKVGISGCGTVMFYGRSGVLPIKFQITDHSSHNFKDIVRMLETV